MRLVKLLAKYNNLQTASAFVSLFLILFQAAVFAQQFGLQMGETVTQVRSKGVSLKKDSKNLGWWDTSYLPHGNNSFQDYSLLFGSKAGLCKIIAATPLIEDSAYGDRTKAKFESLRQALNNRYGEGREYGYLRSGATWSEEHEWMWSIFKKERVLSAFWGAAGPDINQKNLNAIKLEAMGVSPSSSFIMVSYEFKNIDKCLNERSAMTDSNL